MRSGSAHRIELWTVPNTFVASANCGLYCGAIVDFVDINAKTRNMDVEALATKLEAAERDGTLPKVVVPVDFAGTSADLASIRRLADRHGFRILEDASHAVGGYYQNRPVGSSELADITVFSFHPVKIVTTGEGGAATTRSAEIAHRMRLLRNHGISRDPADMAAIPEGPWYYEQVMLGFNYRMTDIQAALGVRQFDRLAKFVARRQTIAERYHEGLAGLPLIANSCQRALSRRCIYMSLNWMKPCDVLAPRFLRRCALQVSASTSITSRSICNHGTGPWGSPVATFRLPKNITTSH